MLPGKKYKPEDVIRILRKRFWVIVVPWALIAAGTAGGARLLPDLYRTHATVQYVPSRVPDSIMRTGSGQGSAGAIMTERYRAIEQVILSRTRLEQMIREFGLYQEELKTRIMEDVAAEMRGHVTATPAKGEIIRIVYVGRNPTQVMKVTQKLAAAIIEESAKDGLRRADAAGSFVEAEVEEKRRQLVEIEDRLKQYKMKYSGEMPTQLGANISAVAGIQNQLQQAGLAKNADQSRRSDVERQIAALENQAGPDAAPLPTADPVAMNGTAAQNLAQAKANLNALIARGVKPDHYNYVHWERQVRTYQKEVNDQALRTPVGSSAGLPPAEQNRLKQLATLRAEVANLNNRLAQIETQEKLLAERVRLYQAKVDSAPLRDAELVQLQREYDTIKGIHDGLVGKREAANMSVNLQRRQIGEQFVLLDEAQLPHSPFSPNRLLISTFGVAGGLAVGLLLVAFLEYRDSSFKNDSDLASVLELPVLAVVPLMLSDAERRARFRRRLILNLGLGSTVMVCLAVLAYSIVFAR